MGFVFQDCIKTWWFVDIEPGRVLNGIERMKKRCDGNIIDGIKYIVFECSIVCRSVEDVGAGFFVTIKGDVSERVVIVVT